MDTEPVKRYTDTHPITAVILVILTITLPLILAKCHNDAKRAATADRPTAQQEQEKPKPDPLLDAYILWQSF